MKTFQFKHSIRYFFKNKGYFLVNTLGLCLGITSFLIIINYVKFEFSYDKFYPQYDQIYRLTMEKSSVTATDEYCSAPGSFGLNLKNEYPEIKEVVRMRGVSSLITHYSTLKFKDKSIYTDKIFFADSTYFNVFKHKFITGNPKFALNEPNSIVLTKSLANKLFGKEEAINAIIQYEYRYTLHTAKVTGIIEDLPQNTHLPIEALVSFSSTDLYSRYKEANVGAHLYTYLQIPQKENEKTLRNKFPSFYDKYLKELYDSLNISCSLDMQPINSIHLESDLIFEPYQNGNKMSVSILMMAGTFLILLSAINYINLMTATSSSRIKEIAIKKIAGAHKHILVLQLLAETIILTTIAVILSLIAIHFILPIFNQHTNIHLDFFTGRVVFDALILILFTLFLGIFSGIYPSTLISRFKPISLISDTYGIKGKMDIRKILVAFQLFTSVLLIQLTFIVNKQFQYSVNQSLGYDKQNIVTFQVKDTLLINNLQAIKSDLASIPGIIDVSSCSNIPGEELNATLFSGINPNGTSTQLTSKFMFVDENFIEMMNMNILEGENFDYVNYEDNPAALINETAMSKFGWANLEGGERMCWGNYDGSQNTMKATGVINDFHWMSVHNKILPTTIVFSETPIGLRLYMYVKIEKLNQYETIKALNKYFSQYELINYPKIELLEDRLFNQYQIENRTQLILLILAGINLAIACIGLIGLISFITDQKRKELSIRKVLGATSFKNFLSIFKDFFVLIAISNILSWPLVYYLAKSWLNNFAYRININLSVFVLTFIISALITFVVISFRLIKSVNENPINALRQE